MKKKILAIDDSQAIRFLLQTVFEKNYEVSTAPDGYSAMNHLTKKNLPDLIIANPRLPGLKDWELIEYLTASGLYGDIPIMVLSGFDKKETQTKCKEFSVNQFFLKPFNPLDLVKAVDNFTAVKNKAQPVS
ncbi:MAG TPA: response regulator [Chitinophagaceae bacterium]|jgi:CheY-like chemotaxis protein|nr:response regulator [Chitinophagaceae bacterium]